MTQDYLIQFEKFNSARHTQLHARILEEKQDCFVCWLPLTEYRASLVGIVSFPQQQIHICVCRKCRRRWRTMRAAAKAVAKRFHAEHFGKKRNVSVDEMALIYGGKRK